MTTVKSRNRQYLIESLQAAFRQKGDVTPTSVEADKRKFGLRPKRTYINEFGSWNKAVRAAGLPVREWKGTRGPAETSGRPVPEDASRWGSGHDVTSADMPIGRPGPIMGGFSSMEEYIEDRIRKDEEELRMLNGMLDDYRQRNAQRRVS